MKITVFTPTYNRGELLPRLFDSLQKQTSRQFEWLVIDDGSADNTAEVVEELSRQADFPVRYYRKENGGKHTAYNLALLKAAGDWFVCLDSDDVLAERAVECMCQAMEAFPDKNGMVAYKADMQGTLIGDVFPANVQSLRIHELGLLYHCSGEYVFAYETKIARRFPFPVFEGERFSPEGIVLDMLGQESVLCVVPEILMLCEYQNDGYTAQIHRLIKNNACAYTFCYMQKIDLSATMKDRVLNAGRYHCYKILAKGKGCKYSGNHKLLAACGYPVGVLLYLYYKILRGF